MPALAVEEVSRIARLARLELTEAEEVAYARQLTEILEYARQVSALDTGGVAPTSTVRRDRPVERPDEPASSISLDEALGNAPDAVRDAGLFRVPRVFGP
jgi:aspartyl-tRNA(Asn)/glutamyl-tRNA(Gln) amidotransferase subunit C